MEAIFLQILNMSITASYVIAAVILLRLLLRKAPKKYAYLLWSVVGFRLICPVSFQSFISLFNLLDTTAAQTETAAKMQYIPADIGMMTEPQISTGIPGMNAVINDSLPAATPQYSANPMQMWIFIGTAVWIAGMLALLIYSVISYIRIARRMSTATFVGRFHTDFPVNQFSQSFTVVGGASESDSETPVSARGGFPTYQSEYVRSPFILGFFRPRIYIPYGLDENARCYVLTHEAVHLKRLDYIIKPLSFLLLMVHWFNPLCWLAFYLMGRDMEMSCDEKVLSEYRSADIRKEYSMTLLSFASNHRFTALAFGEVSVKKRIVNALNWKKPALRVTVPAVILCAAALVSFAGNPQSKNSPYRWTSTISAEDIEFVDCSGSDTRIDLTKAEIAALAELLNKVRPSEIHANDKFVAEQATLYIKSTDDEMLLRYYADSVYFNYGEKGWRITNPELSEFITTTLAISPLPFDRYYTVREIVYDAPMYSFTYTTDTAPWYHLTADGKLYNTMYPYNTDWNLLGDHGKESALTKDNFDSCFDDMYSSFASSLRRNNKAAWQYISAEDSNGIRHCYYILQQEDSELYLAEGYADENGMPETIRWVFRLKPLVSQPTYINYAVWEYNPLLSSQYPGFRFKVGFPHMEIKVTCENGTLYDFENPGINGYINGKEITVSDGVFYWCPTTDDTFAVSEDTVTFEVYYNDEITHTGVLTIEPLGANEGDFEKSEHSYYYKASLSGKYLLMTQMQDSVEPGAYIAASSDTIPALSSSRSTIKDYCTVSGTQSTVFAKKYDSTNGFDFDYDSLPIITVAPAEDILTFNPGWDCDKLTIGEDYYQIKSGTGTYVRKNTYEIPINEEGTFTFNLPDRSKTYDEHAIYYILNEAENEKYIIKVLYPHK